MTKKTKLVTYLTVRLHRWQPKQNRYKVQPLTLDPMSKTGEVITDILFRRAMFERDATVKQLIARTQQVDRVMINALDGTIDIWMSPTVERVYNKTAVSKPGQASGFHKPTAADELCDCHHAKRDHAKQGVALDGETWLYGICLVPGCSCRAYLPLESIERIEREHSAPAPVRPITASDPITDEDLGI